MKKHFIYLLAACMTLGMAAPTLSSCGDDDDDPIEKPNTPDTPTPSNPQGDKKLNSTEQKEKLETIAKAFMAEVNANNFTSLKDLASYCYNHYIDNDDFDNDVVSEWFEDALQAAAGISVKTKNEKYGNWIENRKMYNRVIALSNFTGHFTAQSKSWKKETAKDLQFNFTDQDGKKCNITVAHSGDEKKAYITDTEDWYDWDYDSNKGEYTEYVNEYKEYVMVPEHITVTLTQNGSKVIETVVNIDHSAFTGPEVDLSKDGLVTNVIAKIADFTWEVQRAEYSAKSHKASITGYMKKGSTTLATFQAEAGGLDITNESFNDARQATISFDLLGQMQIKATCSNVKKYTELIDQAEENDENGPLFKSYINQANELTDIDVYYDKGSVRQAKMKLMTFEEKSYWSSYSYWDYEPVIYFDDSTSYSTFNAYFNESDFRSVIDTFESLIRGYENLFED